ncbi:hypothetical protein AVEN_57478-1 [Araneus ventricosus]|uniref:ATP-dependent DNA helicase n=1 Tax=Araneus ventricosus TaxID=182803 RepID=A0A4Y2CXV8_ARAVE|nr:hypothetical protein AVEN_57478-1 [Araneus ventricosus]
MGGLIVVLAGGFRQSLPIIPRGTMADEIRACLKSSYLWKQVKIMKLTTNMRIQINCQNSQKFSDCLLKIGDGQEATMGNGKIRLSSEFCKICRTLENLINQVYPDITLNIQNIQWLQECAILTPLNDKVREINFTLQGKVPTAARSYHSIDKCLNDEEATSYPVEFLNSLNPSCIPLHRLELKVGCPIRLLRNLNPPKLCNSSRLIVKALHAHIIEATILTGPFEGEQVLIPRIPLIPIDLPFSFQGLQFPLRPAFVYDKVYKPYHGKNSFTFFPVLLRSKSRGTVRLKSDDPYEHPLIDFNLFQSEEDLDKVVDGKLA